MLAPASIVLMIGFFILVHPPRITKAFCRNRLQFLIAPSAGVFDLNSGQRDQG
jgi:hypothetical protein